MAQVTTILNTRIVAAHGLQKNLPKDLDRTGRGNRFVFKFLKTVLADLHLRYDSQMGNFCYSPAYKISASLPGSGEEDRSLLPQLLYPAFDSF